MEELVILEFQAKQIEDTLRLVANVLKSRNEQTCLDRQVMKSIGIIKACLVKEYMKNHIAITPKGNY